MQRNFFAKKLLYKRKKFIKRKELLRIVKLSKNFSSESEMLNIYRNQQNMKKNGYEAMVVIRS